MRAFQKSQILDPGCAQARAAYERAFFAAFRERIDHPPSRLLWDWDLHAERLRSRVPYADQLVLVDRCSDGAVRAAIAASISPGCKSTFEFEHLGFTAPRRPTECCEILAFVASGNRSVAQRIALWSALNSELYARGFRQAYATSPDKPLRVYCLAGGNVVAVRGVGADRRYLLQFNLSLHVPTGGLRTRPATKSLHLSRTPMKAANRHSTEPSSRQRPWN